MFPLSYLRSHLKLRYVLLWASQTSGRSLESFIDAGHVCMTEDRRFSASDSFSKTGNLPTYYISRRKREPQGLGEWLLTNID